MNEMKQLCLQYDIHPDATAFLTEAYGKLMEKPEAFAVFQQQIEVYRQDHLFDHKPVLEKLHALETDTGVSWMTIDVLYLVCLLPELQEIYRQENIEKEIFDSFLNNIKGFLRGGRDFYGIRTAWWLADFYKLKLFSIGRLQYRRRRFRCDTVCGDTVFPENSYYLDAHIPSQGPLKPDLCRESYQRAAAFYRKRFGDEKIVFGCHSWLLSPDLDELLPEGSNILAFAHQFTLVEATEDTEYTHLTYAFGVHKKPEDLGSLPENSSLQRKLKAWLLEGNILRLGKGFFRYQEE